jgi:hypothetical protein
MAEENPTGLGVAGCPTTRDEEDREQAVVLCRVLELHPDTLTQDELVRDLTGGRPREFSELDWVKRAIGELAGAGLLHRFREEETVRPTRAALRYLELSEASP